MTDSKSGPPGATQTGGSGIRDTEDVSRVELSSETIPLGTSGPGPTGGQTGGETAAGNGGGGQDGPGARDEARDELVGQVLDNRYRVVRLVGEGGMGHVYEAVHEGLQRRVALKVLHKVFSADWEVVERFRREARAASAVGHPNIVQVTDTGTTPDGRAFFVMEFLEGVELADVIIEEGKLDEERAVHIAIQICDAVVAAHKAGVIHRDLKPENVFLVSKEGEPDFVKILDFGIAKTTSLESVQKKGLTEPGFAMGTPEYMAPEQAAGQPVDERADVYAIGGVLYAMLAGRPPHQGRNVMDVLRQKVSKPVEPLSKHRPGISRELERIVMWALEMDPEDRPASAEILGYELRKLLQGRASAVAAMLGLSEAAAGAAEHRASSPSRESLEAYADAAEPLPWETMDGETEPQEVVSVLSVPSLPDMEPGDVPAAESTAQASEAQGEPESDAGGDDRLGGGAVAQEDGGEALGSGQRDEPSPRVPVSAETVVASRPPVVGFGWVGIFVAAAALAAGGAALLWWKTTRSEGRTVGGQQAPRSGKGVPTEVGPGEARERARGSRGRRSPLASSPRVSGAPVDLDRAVRRAWQLARRGRWTGSGEENVLAQLRLFEKARPSAARKLRRYARRRLGAIARHAVRRKAWRRAERAYRDLLALVPGDRDIKKALARVLVARAERLLQEDPATAAALAGEAVILSDGWPTARYVWAIALARTGETEQALTELRRVATNRGCSSRLRRKAARMAAKLKRELSRAEPTDGPRPARASRAARPR